MRKEEIGVDNLDREKQMKDYFTDECVTTKIIGESSETCDVEFVISMDDFYLKSSFVVPKEVVEEWREEKIKKELS